MASSQTPLDTQPLEPQPGASAGSVSVVPVSNAQRPQLPPTTFTLFANLPLEVQDRIWEASLPLEEHMRIIVVGEGNRCTNCHNLNPVPPSRVAVTIGLVCRQARISMQRALRRRWPLSSVQYLRDGRAGQPSSVEVNGKKDIFYLEKKYITVAASALFVRLPDDTRSWLEDPATHVDHIIVDLRALLQIVTTAITTPWPKKSINPGPTFLAVFCNGLQVAAADHPAPQWNMLRTTVKKITIFVISRPSDMACEFAYKDLKRIVFDDMASDELKSSIAELASSAIQKELLEKLMGLLANVWSDAQAKNIHGQFPVLEFAWTRPA
ncbi:hypothetical protein M406DRAFT_73067 [Cryphonectria parasitica EP155]|uniref:2EXR domain-containing protein n=1 Tax=Cryphonectria parasitica (strain ATCC 38755 / EP155) TaxID=660469 RepID=A0A9P4XTB9_CRYP1|nr:uncharacterized protein M406DRAFT_73067 [Cryphonectria parasitica EP155]KAF3760589.1 hypothetical protein M406DRAFT_73067 [Cryphonectria parasitica EP155]